MNPSKFKDKMKKVLGFLLNPKFLLCFGIGWFITNGWSYVLMGIGTYFQIGWMMSVAGAYLAFIWLVPLSPEKIVAFAIAVALLRWWFPGDTKTLAVLKNLQQKAKNAFQSRKSNKKIRRIERRKAWKILWSTLRN